jgi:hypothetical protein
VAQALGALLLALAFCALSFLMLLGARQWRRDEPGLAWACLGLAGLAALLGAIAAVLGVSIIFVETLK